MEVISGSFTSSLNPFAAPYVPTAFRAVEDFSDDWWDLVNSSPWFRDYWLRECFPEPASDDDDETDLVFLDIYNPAIDETDSFFHSSSSRSQEKEKEEVKSKIDIVRFGAGKWKGTRGGDPGVRYYSDKAAKMVNVKVSPRIIHQPR